MPCRSPFYVEIRRGEKEIPVPCGRCPDCRKRRLNDWVFRLQEEDKVTRTSHFVTLTYNTDSVPLCKSGMTLSPYTKKFRIKRSEYVKMPFDWDCKIPRQKWTVHQNKTASNDLTDFFKRLRKKGETFRFYAVGEYGSKTWRPHYHILFFGLRDLENIFRSWDYGHIHIGDVTGASIAYTLKYIDKIDKVPQYVGDERQPEYNIQSKGLGKSWIDSRYVYNYNKGKVSNEIIEFYQENITSTFLYTETGHKIAMPRYYRDRLLSDKAKKDQRHFIDRQLEEKDKVDRQNYRNKKVDFDTRKENIKIAEWNKFMNSIKKRDKL